MLRGIVPISRSRAMNARLLVLLLPVYVVGMIIVGAVFGSPGSGTKGNAPWWLVVVFTLAALALFALVMWLLTRTVGVQASDAGNGARPQRYSVMTEFISAWTAWPRYAAVALAAGVVVSRLVAHMLAAIASDAFAGRSLWMLVPIYIFSYTLLFGLAGLIAHMIGELASDERA